MTRSEKLFVWLGGAVFVASLAASAYRYFFTWSASTGFATLRPVAFDAALFMVFAFHHSLFARESVKRLVERVVPRHLLRSVYVWTASLLFLAVPALWTPIGGDIYQTRGVLVLALIVVQLAGVWLIARSASAIDPLELAGIRSSSGREPLQIAGPYRFVRHPLYLGWTLLVFGVAHMTGDRLAFAAMTTTYLIVAIPWEERSLARIFGDEYKRYREQVRWRMVPYVY